MNSCSSSFVEVRRARPLLGTIVEIQIRSAGHEEGTAAIERAFAAIARVHRLMSPHEENSDVARINRVRPGRVLRLHAWTFRVLSAARKMSAKSRGVFDITVRGSARSSRHRSPAGWADMMLKHGNRVWVRRELTIDLGGIAKGFAVDQAVAVLRRAGVSSGVVNAGGDLRVFGAHAETIHLRQPFSPHEYLVAAELASAALATSSNCLDPVRRGRLVRPDGRRLWLRRGSVSVIASTALMADALCKVVAVVGLRSAMPLLRTSKASALIVGRLRPDHIEVFPHAA